MEESHEITQQGNSKWHEGRPQEAYKLALLGLTDSQMAEYMEISMSAFCEWKRVHENFRLAVKDGKTKADAEVAMSLYKRAVGYDYDEDHVSIFKGVAVVTTLRKHVPPDPWSASKWLSLRQGKNWSETQKVEVTTTSLNINKFDFTGISNEDLQVIKKLGLQQIAKDAGSGGN